MIESLEGLEDLDIARGALAEVREAGDDRERAGWLRWGDVGEELSPVSSFAPAWHRNDLGLAHSLPPGSSGSSIPANLDARQLIV